MCQSDRRILKSILRRFAQIRNFFLIYFRIFNYYIDKFFHFTDVHVLNMRFIQVRNVIQGVFTGVENLFNNGDRLQKDFAIISHHTANSFFLTPVGKILFICGKNLIPRSIIEFENLFFVLFKF